MSEARMGSLMSLDGFISGPNENPGDPLGAGDDTEYVMPSGTITLKVSPRSARLLRKSHEKTGALVVVQRHFDLAGGRGDRHPMDLPVVTHTVPDEWVHEGSPFTFVTEGVEDAVEMQKAVAGDKDVGVGRANVAQQAIRVGLVDEVGIDLVPVLLEGIRFFNRLGSESIELELTRVVEAPGVTHLRFRLVK